MPDLYSAIAESEELYRENISHASCKRASGRLLATGCAFSYLDFSESNMVLDCTDTTFTHCTFDMGKLRDASLSRCKFVGCSFIGADMADSVFMHCSFTGCKADMANFSGSKLQGCTIADCHFFRIDMENCQFKSTSLQNTNLAESYFDGSKLKGIDLTSCNLERMRLRQEDLRGSILTLEQAMGFLWMLGVKIK